MEEVGETESNLSLSSRKIFDEKMTHENFILTEGSCVRNDTEITFLCRLKAGIEKSHDIKESCHSIFEYLCELVGGASGVEEAQMIVRLMQKD